MDHVCVHTRVADEGGVELERQIGAGIAVWTVST
jgi:hypothetical protein